MAFASNENEMDGFLIRAKGYCTYLFTILTFLKEEMVGKLI